MRADNLPVLDLSKQLKEGKEAHYLQITHIVSKLTTNKKTTEECKKRGEFDFILDLKILISKTANDPEIPVKHETRRQRNSTEKLQTDF